VLRECAAALSAPLVRLYRLCLITGSYPVSWRFSLIHPIPKKGDKSLPSNYRPIALTNFLAKVFESLINNHILKHSEKLLLFSDSQYGFRRGRSTADLLTLLTDSWLSSLNSHGETYITALDISKAFDRVWHPALLAKLPSFGITPLFCSIIKNFLANRSFAVVVEGSISNTFNSDLGVPQGAILSPTLFLIFINDLLSSTTNKIHSFADDSTLHHSSKFKTAPTIPLRTLSHIATSISLNHDLVQISAWGLANQVKFNSIKTQFLPISLSPRPSSVAISFDKISIPPSHNISLLGSPSIIDSLGVPTFRGLQGEPPVSSVRSSAFVNICPLPKSAQYTRAASAPVWSIVSTSGVVTARRGFYHTSKDALPA
jgi:hypothetical protein